MCLKLNSYKSFSRSAAFEAVSLQSITYVHINPLHKHSSAYTLYEVLKSFQLALALDSKSLITVYVSVHSVH